MPAKEVSVVVLFPPVFVPRVHCLVSSSDDLSLLADLAHVGVDGFQVRDKEADTATLVDLTRTVLGAVRPLGARVLVNDRLDVALATGADGVHLGRSDLAVPEARRLAPHLLIGATCRDRAQIDRAADEGADYAGFGPVHATLSKAGLPEPLGVDAVAAAVGAALPVVAIGGIDAPGARAVRSRGAHGVAVIGAVWRAPDPVSAAKELVRAVL